MSNGKRQTRSTSDKTFASESNVNLFTNCREQLKFMQMAGWSMLWHRQLLWLDSCHRETGVLASGSLHCFWRSDSISCIVDLHAGGQ